MSERPVILSACVAGVACTHEAEAKTRDWAVRLISEGRAVTVCPEVAGGLPIPRPAAEIIGGDGSDVLDGRARVIDEHGTDVTEQYLAGARSALAAARRSGATRAILKARSPSCGRGEIFDGTFGGGTRAGDGVTAALLAREGIEVLTDEQFDARFGAAPTNPEGTGAPGVER